MKMSRRIKPISYLKSHAADVVRELGEEREPLIITQNGEARLVVQDIESFEEREETIAMLKILALGDQQVQEDKTRPARQVLKRLRTKYSAR